MEVLLARLERFDRLRLPARLGAAVRPLEQHWAALRKRVGLGGAPDDHD